MKKLCLLFIVSLLFVGQSFSQDRVSEKKLIGNWKMIIDIEEEMDEAKKEMDEEDNILGELFMSSISGLVEGIIENIDINFEFKRGGEVILIVEALQEESEEEYLSWEINRRGELQIIGETDNVNLDEDDYWLMEGNKLLLFEDGELKENIYLLKIE